AVNPTSTCPWIVQNITVSNNDFSRSTAMYEFYALDKGTGRPADIMHITLNGNLFLNRSGATGPWPIGWGNGDIWTPTNYATVRAWEVAHVYPVQNSATTVGITAASQTVTSVLVGTPTSVAALLGVPAGTRHLGAF
ncbi:MAG: hypothetical protein JWO15_3806, partial [Sphingomonadales bacterium]|nr:hypothetical protein [Sphingomonadales bacterium]